MSNAAAAEPMLGCRFELLPPGAARAGWALRFTLHNRGPRAAHVLAWGTPFEGWLAPWVRVRHTDQDLPYRGAAVKRGDPGAEEYVRIEAGRRRQTTVDLAPAFDVSRPGRYEIEPQLQLFDVLWAPARPPRPRAAFEPQALDCPSLRFTVGPG